MRLYKMTDGLSRTRPRPGTSGRSTQWGEGATNRVPRVKKPELCSPDVLHAFTSPVLASMLWPSIMDYGGGRQLWLAEGKVAVSDGMKVGVFSLTTVKRTPIPRVSDEARRRFALLVLARLGDEKGDEELGDAARAATRVRSFDDYRAVSRMPLFTRERRFVGGAVIHQVMQLAYDPYHPSGTKHHRAMAADLACMAIGYAHKGGVTDREIAALARRAVDEVRLETKEVQ